MDHPFRAWRESTGIDREAAAGRVRVALQTAGRNSQFSEAYLYQIEAGKASPGWPVCKAMQAVTGDAVSAARIKDWSPPAPEPPAPPSASEASAPPADDAAPEVA